MKVQGLVAVRGRGTVVIVDELPVAVRIGCQARRAWETMAG